MISKFYRMPFALSFRAVVAAGTTVLILAAGCSEVPPVSTATTEAMVKGKVTIKGKLATEGKVVFDPANYARKDVTARSAPIEKDGTYSIKTLLGLNQIRVEGKAIQADRELGDTSIPFEVLAGDNTFDIVLPLPAVPDTGRGSGK